MDNNQLMKFLALKEQIAKLEKELKPIKDEIEAAGSMETEAFIVEVKEVTMHRVVGCDELLEKVGFVEVNRLSLIRDTTYNKVTVKQKATA